MLNEKRNYWCSLSDIDCLLIYFSFSHDQEGNLCASNFLVQIFAFRDSNNFSFKLFFYKSHKPSKNLVLVTLN